VPGFVGVEEGCVRQPKSPAKTGDYQSGGYKIRLFADSIPQLSVPISPALFRECMVLHRRRLARHAWIVATAERRSLNPKSSIEDRDDFSADFFPVHDQAANRDGQLKPPWPRAAGIEIEHALARFLLWDVAVTRDYYAESCGFRVQIKLSEIVKNINGNAGNLDDFGFRQLVCPCAFVDIAANRRDWGNVGELVKYLGRANVTRVEDAVRPT
jgi:hypothetical protein